MILIKHEEVNLTNNINNIANKTQWKIMRKEEASIESRLSKR